MAFSIHHFGVVVNDLESTMETYRKILEIPAPEMGVFDMKDDALKFTMMPMAGGIIELLQPEEGKPSVHGQRLLDVMAQRGEGFFQLALFSDDYDADMARLREQGFEPEEYLVDFVFDTKLRVSFLKPETTSGLLFELVDAAGVPEGMR
jgi:hypothetical protein